MRTNSAAAAVLLAALASHVTAAGPTTAPTTAPTSALTTAPTTAPVGPRVVRLTLHPVAVADPVLRYPLLPPPADRHPGDAAYEYARATGELSPVRYNDAFWDKLDPLLDAPPDAFPAAAAAELLMPPGLVLSLADSAARCERAHWENGLREHGFGTLLPQLNPIRFLANLIDAQARLEVSRGDWTAAARRMQTSLSLAYQLRDEPCFVQSVVGVRTAELTLGGSLAQWVCRPASPNLYWSLSALPPTVADLHATVGVERSSLRNTDRPWMALAVDDQLPAGEWPRVTRTFARLDTKSYPPQGGAIEIEPARARLVAEFEARARDHLRAAGRAGVAAMAADEAVGRYLVYQSGPAQDAAWAAWLLPFPDAAPRLAAWDVTPPAGAHDSPVAFPHMLQSRYTLARADEQLAALRVIEALRDHAARHGGRPPATLDEVTALPLPADPVTGRPFAYHADGATATLDLPAPPHVSPGNGTRYELTFATP